MKKEELIWNYYDYFVFNLTTGKQVAESDDYDNIKSLLVKCKKNNPECTYVIQQQHVIARVL